MIFRLQARDPLADLELFSDSTVAEVADARKMLTLLTVEPGTVLMSEGSFGLEFMIIADGEAQVSVGTGADERVLATLGRGDFVGEMSLLGRKRRSATVTALTPLTIYVANVAEFAGLLDAAPSVADRITNTAAERREANRRSAVAA
jgi:CRP-like cAMP-binding protein